MPLTWKQFERYWYIFSLIVIFGSLPFSKLGISIGQFMIAGGWIVERFDARKLISYLTGRSLLQIIFRIIPYSLFLLFDGIASGFRQFARNKAAVLFSSIILMHLLGLLFTTDFDYALKDLRTKIPFLLLPLFLSTAKPFDNTAFRRILLFFVAAVLVRSLFNTWMIQTNNFVDIRDVSHNVSHIIFSLLLTIGIFILFRFCLKKHPYSFWQKGIFLLIALWYFFYMLLSRSFTGYSVTMITLLILAILVIFSTRNKWLRSLLATSILIGALAVFFSLKSIVNDYYRINPLDVTKLEKFSSRGNPYFHDIYAPQTENGNLLGIYVQEDEMRSAWNKRSSIQFDSLNMKKDPVAYTLIRYLTSKGWRKDADAVERLSNQEVRAIEKGVANWIFLEKFSIRSRIYEFLRGYDYYKESGNPTGFTLMQRLEFWKASIGIIKENWVMGVGTGDMNIAFHQQYEKMHTKLSRDQRWRSHNQFLSIFIGFGIIGFLWFLIAIFYPPVMLGRKNDFFVITFLIISTLSMLTGDTIETQTGVTFFVLFYSFFLFARMEKDPLCSRQV